MEEFKKMRRQREAVLLGGLTVILSVCGPRTRCIPVTWEPVRQANPSSQLANQNLWGGTQQPVFQQALSVNFMHPNTENYWAKN